MQARCSYSFPYCFFFFVLQIDVIHQEVFYYQTMKIYPATLTIYDSFLFWTDVRLWFTLWVNSRRQRDITPQSG